VFVEADGTVIWDSTLIAEYLDETIRNLVFTAIILAQGLSVVNGKN
jgi:hypothetical protein